MEGSRLITKVSELTLDQQFMTKISVELKLYQEWRGNVSPGSIEVKGRWCLIYGIWLFLQSISHAALQNFHLVDQNTFWHASFKKIALKILSTNGNLFWSFLEV